MADLAELLVRLDATTEGLRRELKRGESAVDDSSRRIDAATKRINQSFQSTTAAARLNQQGLLSLQASGVNAFQALASGMSPFRVAMTEGAQVLGALVQGGILTFSNALNLLKGPLGLVVGAVTAAGAAFALMGGSTKSATEAHEELAKALQEANDLTESAIDKSLRLAEAKRQEKKDTLALLLATQQENLANLERDKSTAALAQSGLQGRADKTIGAKESLEEGQSVIRDIDRRLGQLRVDIAETMKALNDLDHPATTSELGKGLGLDDAAKAGQKSDEAAFKELVDNLVKTGEARDKARQAIDDQVEGLRTEAAAVQESERARFIANEALKAERTLRQSQLDSGEIEQRIALVKEEAAANYDAGAAAKARDKAQKDADRLDKQRADELGRMFESSFDRIGEAITQMSLEGQDAFKDLANVGKAIASELMQEFIKLSLINPLKNALFGGNSPTMQDAGGALGSIFSGILGAGSSTGAAGSAATAAFMADGGPVSASTPFIVGERGPELFVPNTSGTIVSNDNLGRMGGGPTYYIDARGADAARIDLLERRLMALNASVEPRARSTVQDAMRRGAIR